MIFKLRRFAFDVKARIFRRNARKLYSELERAANSSNVVEEDELVLRLKEILVYAYENTEFYRDLYDRAAFDVYSFQRLTDFNNVPIVTKNHVEHHGNQMRSRAVSESVFVKSVTGGSSGKPTTVYHDKRNQLEGIGWFCMAFWDVHPGDNAVFLERYDPSSRGQVAHLLNKVLWWPTKRAHLDIRNVDDERLVEFYKLCRKIEPVYVEGYVGAVVEFAHFLMKNNLRLPSVRLVWTTSAPLTSSVRSTLEAAFSCRVVDQYGCCEVYWLGAELGPKGVLQTFEPLRYIEVVGDGGAACEPGVFGDVLLTDLLNKAFPIIRYENGDRAAREREQFLNGMRFNALKPVKGRTSENVRKIGGGFIAGEFLTTLFDDYPLAVAQFQVVQSSDYSVVVRAVPRSGVEADQQREDASEYIMNLFSDAGLACRLEFVDEISHDNGKLRYVVSEV